MWSGNISLGGLTFYTYFLIFDCQGAFDVILGKPWLHEACAIHHYATDTIIISTDTETAVIGNVEDTNELPNTPTPEPAIATTPTQTSLDDLILTEVHHIEALHRTDGPFAESRWAQYLDIEPVNEDDDDTSQKSPETGVKWFTTRAEQKAIERAKWKECQMDNRKHRAEILDWLSREAEAIKKQTPEHDTTDTLEPAATQRQRIDQEYTDQWRQQRATIAIIQSFQDTNTNPLDIAATHSLINSERRLSNLRTKLDHLWQMASPTSDHDNTTHVHVANVVSNQDFAIDRGDNTSTQISDPFTSERVDEIIQKIELGPDLTDEQRERIKALVRDYADVFTLSLSEVRVVDWYKHHLNVDPSIKLPIRTSQRPVTEAQNSPFSDLTHCWPASWLDNSPFLMGHPSLAKILL
jgi:hypothetical protein